MPGDAHLTMDATTITWRGHTFRVSPDAFMQVNLEQVTALYGVVTDALQPRPGMSIVDAYAGVGMLPVQLAAEGARVLCIESNRAAARLGVLNARINGVEARVSYVLGAAETALPQRATGPTVDAVVLDPPRAGCGAPVTAWLALAGPRRVVYVSCDPATLARDLRVLAVSGPYRVERLHLVDMFPQTYHVEAVAGLMRG
jgi:23S rRNA (uracil1939-C5)-methyltransferase